mmetsp:Transcript_177008/g.567622  ORF Transcript_177008/g.567622 Transcript_177008/m.567622 type:complete len:210 (-) Transcript_177008:444-1073(-)
MHSSKLCLTQVLTPAAVAASVQFATHLGSPRPSHSEGRSGESSRVFFHGASDMSMLSTSPTCTTCCCTSLSRPVCEDGALRILTAESIPPLPPLLHFRSMPRTVVNAAVVGEGAPVAHDFLASNSKASRIFMGEDIPTRIYDEATQAVVLCGTNELPSQQVQKCNETRRCNGPRSACARRQRQRVKADRRQPRGPSFRCARNRPCAPRR